MLDVLYIAWNRLEFTRFTFECLLQNTNWGLVDRLVVCDDLSFDGTREYLQEAIGRAPVATEFRGDTHLGTSVQHLRNYVDGDAAVLFSVVENDLAVPPGWLEPLVDVMDRNPGLDLLGMECSWSEKPAPGWDGVYNWDPWGHIGGNGIMRRSAFRVRPPFRTLDLSGFEIWQRETNPVRGWITPDIPVCLLDRHPFDPWLWFSDRYERRGWQRPWAKISQHMTFYWDWFPEEWIPASPVRTAV